MIDDDRSNAEQPIFGVGVMRKRIDFVPATTTDIQLRAPSSILSVRDRYLSIVLKDRTTSTENRSNVAIVPPNAGQNATSASNRMNAQDVCEICNLPLSANTASKPHDLALAHQVCLQHSHPPSHLDRNRQGIKYLSSYGWDIDSRRGLGPSGVGIRAPIKARVKNDTLGLGVELPGKKTKPGKVVMLDAGKMRKKMKEEGKQREVLQEMFYGNEDVERYLGGQ